MDEPLAIQPRPDLHPRKRSTVSCSSTPARIPASQYSRLFASRMIVSIPAVSSSRPSVIPAGPAPRGTQGASVGIEHTPVIDDAFAERLALVLSGQVAVGWPECVFAEHGPVEPVQLFGECPER